MEISGYGIWFRDDRWIILGKSDVYYRATEMDFEDYRRFSKTAEDEDQ